MLAEEHDESEKSSGSSHVKPSSFDERTWTFFIIGFVLLVTGLSFLWRQPSLSRTPGSPYPQLSSAMVPLATGEEPIAQLFSQAGCIVCHTIPGIAGAQGRVGPALLLGSTGSTRLADPAYRGEAKTLREYIVESILAPGVYVVSGYPDRVMPQWYGQKLSAGALNKIADYLERVTEDGAPLRSEAN